MHRTRSTNGYRAAAVALLLAVPCLTAKAEVRLPGFFNDHMVLQRNMPVQVWGWADPSEAVTVSFDGQVVPTTADTNGNWLVTLAAMSADAVGQTLTVNSVAVQDVVIGEVWLCSGQSNMQWPVEWATNAAAEIAASDYPAIRLMTIAGVATFLPRTDAEGTWQVCGPATSGGFSAVAYYFGRSLHLELNVPIGLVDSSWGGTGIEPWTSHLGYSTVPELSDEWAVVNAGLPTSAEGLALWNSYLDELGVWLPPAQAAVAAGELPRNIPDRPSLLTDAHYGATKIFNAMIHPLINYSIRGVIWYQGESNNGSAFFYYYKLKALIEGWRGMWNQGDFPFYVVQLANLGAYNDDPEGGDGYARIREAQRQSLQFTNTGLAVITDIGETDKIHPGNKQDVGARLALWALAKDYGYGSLVYSGPLYESVDFAGGQAEVHFSSVGTGLMVGKKIGLDPTQEVFTDLEGFAIAGSDQAWYWADATISAGSNTVILTSADVPDPVAVRYAYRWNPINSNLYNREGLPASPFRTDDW